MKKSAQEIQDEIFKKMPFEKKLKLALDFSIFCLKIQKRNFYGSRKSIDKSNPSAGKS